jgi:hypothetical protein
VCLVPALSADLYDAGFTNQTNIDFSPVVIDHMQAQHREARPEIVWLTMDMTKMHAADGTGA